MEYLEYRGFIVARGEISFVAIKPNTSIVIKADTEEEILEKIDEWIITYISQEDGSL